jgi:hypothetical protein
MSSGLTDQEKRDLTAYLASGDRSPTPLGDDERIVAQRVPNGVILRFKRIDGRIMRPRGEGGG